MWYVVIVQYSIHLSSFIITRDIFSLRHCRQMSWTYDVEGAYEKMAAKYMIYMQCSEKLVKLEPTDVIFMARIHQVRPP